MSALESALFAGQAAAQAAPELGRYFVASQPAGAEAVFAASTPNTLGAARRPPSAAARLDTALSTSQLGSVFPTAEAPHQASSEFRQLRREHDVLLQKYAQMENNLDDLRFKKLGRSAGECITPAFVYA